MTVALGRDDYLEALNARVKVEILDRCTRCGACAEVCPIIPVADVASVEPPTLVDGVLSILAGEDGSPASTRWVEACCRSGPCVPACAYGVDPLFMMEMAGIALRQRKGAKQVQANATRAFQSMAKSVRYLSRLFLKPEIHQRLDPRFGRATDGQSPDAIFYTGCNVLRTPHIALIALDILDLIGANYEVMGGPSHCCGAYQVREGDIGAASGMAMSTIGKMVKARAPEVISWCPSCDLQFGRTHLPTYSATNGGTSPFDFTPFYRFVDRRLADLVPHMKHAVPRRVALDERAFDPQVNAAVRRILGLIPGLDLVELDVAHVGIMRNMMPTESLKRTTREEAFAAATAAGVTTLATVYHACHRELVSYSDTVSFEIVNVIELIADCLGIAYHDSYKEFQLVTDVERYIERRMDLVESHRLSLDDLRAVALDEFAAHHPV